MCIALAENTPACTYITGTQLYGAGAGCREALQEKLTYNACVTARFSDKDFDRAHEWRVYLNQPRRLWKNSYEVIRLLDDQYRTVDVFTY